MSDYDREQMAMDVAILDEQKGSDLKAVGWSLLVFSALPSLFIFTGWRAGSWFWVWYTGMMGAIGLGLVGAGTFLQSRSVRDFADAGVTIRSRAVPTIRAEELPMREGTDREAA